MHVSERDGSSCQRWRISATGSGVEEPQGYILGRVREILHGGVALPLGDPDVKRLQAADRLQDGLYFRRYYRRAAPRNSSDGIVTRPRG